MMTATLRLRSTLVIAMLAMAPVGARAQSGVVAGSVFDSISGSPLADAAVFLWETSYRAVTDEQGRFRMDDIPAGEYSILFYHTRLGEMGISAGPRALEVRAGASLDVRLATPSMATIVRSQCLMEDRPTHTGAVAGRITDSGTDLALSGARVSLSWHEEGAVQPLSIQVGTGPDGWYRSCAVPIGVPVLLSADYYGRQGPRREITVGQDGFINAAVNLLDVEPSRISGRLKDRDTGNGVEGAETWLRGTSFRTLTNGRGAFVFDAVPSGTYMLMTDHLAYGTKMDTLIVPDGQRLTVEMLLDNRPITIAPLTVSTEAPQVDMARRRGGIVITRDEIDQVRQRSRDASDIIRSLHLPGVLVRHSSNGTICVGYITGQVKMNQTGCVEMLVFINDVRATDPNVALRLPPDAIERMVMYKPVDAGNLFGLGGGNGVWMIYTRGN